MEMVAARAHEKGLALVCEIAPDVPTDLVGDPTRLRQVLLNLLGNAIKFTESGEVSLRVAPDGNSSVPTALRFTISDTGIGIPGEKLGRVFERFTQADSSTTRRFGGSGLGLTISKRLVELMGGRIWVESTSREGQRVFFRRAVRDLGRRPSGRRPCRSARVPSRRCRRCVFFWWRTPPTTARSRWPIWRTRRTGSKSPRPGPSPVKCLQPDTTTLS